MATLTYVPKNGDPLLDAEKIESLRLSNAIQRAKLSRIDGELISKREVTFMLGHTLVFLRTQILTIPQLVSAELRGALDNTQAHAIRMRVEDAVHRFLTQLSENMENTINSEAFLAKLEAELNGKSDEDAAKLKRDLAKRRRTAKRHAKARK
jgi:hypothetical protein